MQMAAGIKANVSASRPGFLFRKFVVPFFADRIPSRSHFLQYLLVLQVCRPSSHFSAFIREIVIWRIVKHDRLQSLPHLTKSASGG
jgi:hypothetical protein